MCLFEWNKWISAKHICLRSSVEGPKCQKKSVNMAHFMYERILRSIWLQYLYNICNVLHEKKEWKKYIYIKNRILSFKTIHAYVALYAHICIYFIYITK